MAKNEMKILLSVDDKASGQLKSFQSRFKAHQLAIAAAIGLSIVAVKKLADALIGAEKELINTAAHVESLQVRLRTLLGSAEAGNKVFDDMARLAGKVPKTFDEIMTSATDLAAVVKDGTEDINKLMPIIVDISSATGISVRDVTSQMIRMYSAGAASADMFRERGVLAALGFQAGVSYSSEETIKTITKQWEDGTGKFVGASKDLAETFDGMVSMMQDAWFQFKVDIGAQVFENVKLDMNAILELIRESKEEGGEYAQVVEELSDFFAQVYEGAKNFVEIALVGGAQLVDAWNEFKLVINSIRLGLLNIQEGMVNIQMMELFFVGANEAAQEYADKLVAIRDEIAAVEQQNIDLATRSNVDYSTQMSENVSIFRKALEEKKKELVKYQKETDKLKDKNAEVDIKRAKELNKKLEEQDKAAKEKERERIEKLENFKGRIYEKGFDLLIRMLEKAGEENVGFAIAAKAVSFGKAIIAAHLAAAEALAAFAYNPPLAATMSAWMLGLGYAEAAMIAATNFLAEGTDTVPAMLTPGEMVFPRSMADAIRSGDISVSGPGYIEDRGVTQHINIEINNPVVSSLNDIDELVEEISYRLQRETERSI